MDEEKITERDILLQKEALKRESKNKDYAIDGYKYNIISRLPKDKSIITTVVKKTKEEKDKDIDK